MWQSNEESSWRRYNCNIRGQHIRISNENPAHHYNRYIATVRPHLHKQQHDDSFNLCNMKRAASFVGLNGQQPQTCLFMLENRHVAAYVDEALISA